MKRIIIIFLVLLFILCRDKALSKDDKQSIFTNMLLLMDKNNRLNVSGTAVKGILKNASVVVNPLNKQGSCDTSRILATGSTDEEGNYSLTYYRTGSVVCLTVSSDFSGQTKLFDEKTNSNVAIPASSTFKLITILPESKIINNSRKNAMVSPFSKLLSRRLQYLVKQAGDSANTNSLFRKASKEIVIRFGLQNGLSAASGKSLLTPKATTSSISDKDYPELDDIILELENPNSPLTAKFISILVGFSQLANKYKKGTSISIDDIDAMIEAFAIDFEDGVFDGLSSDGKPVTLGSGVNQITFSSFPLTEILLPAISSYLQEGGKLTVGRTGTSAVTFTSVQVASQIQFVDIIPIVSSDSSSATISLSYSGSPFTYNVGTAITSISPTVTGGTINSYAVTPSLPTGLSLNAASGVISGTPSNTSSTTSYTITGTGTSGSATANISITVNTALPKRIFVTTSAFYNGNLGGASGADTKCMTDASKPNSSTYKAMIADGSTRRACTTANCSGGISENLGWVLLPNQAYVRSDGVTPIATTNSAAIFTFPLTNAIQASGTNIWTGLAIDFTNNGPGTCTGWTTTAGNGSSGTSGATNNTSINAVASQPCGGSISIYCIEQ